MLMAFFMSDTVEKIIFFKKKKINNPLLIRKLRGELSKNIDKEIFFLPKNLH